MIATQAAITHAAITVAQIAQQQQPTQHATQVATQAVAHATADVVLVVIAAALQKAQYQSGEYGSKVEYLLTNFPRII